VGAKDWMVVYADGDVRPVLQAAPPIDRDETRALVRRLYPSRRVVEIEDGSLFEANPPQDQLLAGCFPGLTVICTADAALDRPSTLDQRFLDEGKGRTVILHAMHSVVDWFAYALWTPDGALTRSLSLSPDNGVIENIGDPASGPSTRRTTRTPIPCRSTRSNWPRRRCARCSASPTRATTSPTTRIWRRSCSPDSASSTRWRG
jgi:hypothetical protein